MRRTLSERKMQLRAAPSKQSTLIPLEYSLRGGLRTPIKMQAFDCAPGPKVVALEATVDPKQHYWPYYPGDLVQVEVHLNHGWLNLLFELFLPTRHLWFDPHNHWHYVGGLIQRYFYGGRQILLVRANHRTTEGADRWPDFDPNLYG